MKHIMISPQDKVNGNLGSNKRMQKEFFRSYLESNQDKYEEALEEVRIMNPRRYVELCLEMSKVIMPKETHVNVNVGINKDFRELHMLATTKVAQREIDGKTENVLERMEPVEDVDFEEIPKQENGMPTMSTF